MIQVEGNTFHFFATLSCSSLASLAFRGTGTGAESSINSSSMTKAPTAIHVGAFFVCESLARRDCVVYTDVSTPLISNRRTGHEVVCPSCHRGDTLLEGIGKCSTTTEWGNAADDVDLRFCCLANCNGCGGCISFF